MASRGSVLTFFFSSFLFAACGSDTRQTVTAPTGETTASSGPAVGTVQVGTAGDRSSALRPGETLQLWAQAKYADGTTSDVTNVAVWQSSNPVVATVSNQGVLTAALEGPVDILATYQKVPGSLHADIRKAGCDMTTLAPAAFT